MTSQEADGIKAHFDKVAAELRSEMAQGLTGVRAELSDFRRDSAAVADHLMEEILESRHIADAADEELLTRIKMVAEGVALCTERMGDIDLRVDSLTQETRRGFAGVRAEIHRLHETDDELLRRIEAQEQHGA